MIKLKLKDAGHPYYNRIVGAEMDKKYNVFEFIDEILKKYPKDYGWINIDDNISCEYKNGVLDWALIPQELFNRVVENVEGMSSYYNTDYKLILKSEKPKEEKAGVDIEGMLNEISDEMHAMRRKYEEKYGIRIQSILVDRYKNKGLSTDYTDGFFGFNIAV